MSDVVVDPTPVILLPDAGPLITLAYGQALDLLLKPDWPVRKISTRAYLRFLEGKGWIDSAAEVERAAVAHGRNFSQLHFPP